MLVKIKSAIEIVMLSISLFGTLGLSFFQNDVLKYTVLSVIIASIILFIGMFVTYMIHLRRQQKLTSSVGISQRAYEVCKKMDKVIKKTDKKLKKYAAVDEFKLSKERRRAAVAAADDREVRETTEKKRRQLVRTKSKCIEAIMGMDRILLIGEQYSFRIAFGRYVLEDYEANKGVAVDYDSTRRAITACLDYIGWTNVILGKTKVATEYINKGIAIIDEGIKRLNKGDERIYALRMQKIRAKRHLGSNYSEYIKHPEACLDFLREGKDMLEEEDFAAFYKGKPEYTEMEAGIKYGMAMCELYMCKLCRERMSEERYNELIAESEEKKNSFLPKTKDFPNKHRYIKYLLLSNSILEEKNRDVFDPDEKGKKAADAGRDRFEKLTDEYNDTLHGIESVLKNTMFSDEAMIYYFSQKGTAIDNEIKKIKEFGV